MVNRTFGYPVGVAVRKVAIVVFAPLFVVGSKSKAARLVGRYILNVLIAIDQLFNALFLGDPDETISSRLGKLERAKTTFYFTRLVIDFLDGIDSGHSYKSIEDDEGEMAIGIAKQ